MLHMSPLTDALLSAFALLVGLVSGSFLCCAAERRAGGESLRGRSRCPLCGHTLGARDLVPLGSYLVLRGRCRYCGGKIPTGSFRAEAVSGLLFLSLLWRFDVSWELLEYALLFALLLYASLRDLSEYIIPDGVILGGVLLRCLALAGSPSPLWEALFALAGGLCVSLPLLMLALGGERALGKETMGGGDIKLFFMLGLYFDWKVNLFLLLCACFLGIVFALAARKGKEERIPFGPAIACGAWVAVMVGERAVSAYLGLFAR